MSNFVDRFGMPMGPVNSAGIPDLCGHIHDSGGARSKFRCSAVHIHLAGGKHDCSHEIVLRVLSMAV